MKTSIDPNGSITLYADNSAEEFLLRHRFQASPQGGGWENGKRLRDKLVLTIDKEKTEADPLWHRPDVEPDVVSEPPCTCCDECPECVCHLGAEIAEFNDEFSMLDEDQKSNNEF